MPRRLRSAPAGFVYHVVNRSAGRLILFESSEDYSAFIRLLSQAQRRTPMRVIAYCIMPNHWHLLLWPEQDGAMSPFIKWLAAVHAARWRLAHDAIGRGAVYQSRFKSVPVQTGQQLLTVWRYVERNPLRADLVNRAELWPWSSLGASTTGNDTVTLGPSPLATPSNWVERVNALQTADELAAIRNSVDSGQPFGDVVWAEVAKQRTGWRPRGRPSKRGRPPFLPDKIEKGVRPLF